MRMVLASVALAGLLWAGAGAAPAISRAEAASFDCTRAGSPTERAICGSRALEDRDVEMATIFGLIRPVFAMGGRGAFIDEQNAWLLQRNRCGSDTNCLRRRYDERIAALRLSYQRNVMAQTPLYRP
jgi:uncharacterized protein